MLAIIFIGSVAVGTIAGTAASAGIAIFGLFLCTSIITRNDSQHNTFLGNAPHLQSRMITANNQAIELRKMRLSKLPMIENKDELKKQIAKAKSAMLRAAKEMNFNEAARLRDEMYSLEKMLGEKE
jgi:excinuclease UvrABC helicase subunit UvrB